tara:strand:+ start:2929 stop:3261 length:333 start_codon:yes stop_codon:yes gene_type:complete
MAIKIYGDGGLVTVNDGTEIQISTFSYYQYDNNTITIVNNSKQAYAWNDLFSNIQKEDGTQAAATLQLTMDYLADIQLLSYNGLASDMFEGRVTSDGGTFESKTCLTSLL